MAVIRVVDVISKVQQSVYVPIRVKVCGLCPKDEIVVVGPTGILAEYAPRTNGCAYIDVPEFDNQAVYVGAMTYLFAHGLISGKDTVWCHEFRAYSYPVSAAAIIGARVNYTSSFYSSCVLGVCGVKDDLEIYGFMPAPHVILKVVRIDYTRYENGRCVKYTVRPTNTWDWLFSGNNRGFVDYVIPRINGATLCIRRDGKIIRCANSPVWNGVVTYYIA